MFSITGKTPTLTSITQNPTTGPYLDDPKVAKEFTDAYMEMVAGFLTFPLKFPGTAVWRAMKVRLLLLVLCWS